MIKRSTLLLSLLLCAAAVIAQDLHVYYNLQTQGLRYVIDSQQVSRPFVRKGSNVILHIENYNNYLYDVVIQQENQEVRLPASVSPTSLSTLFPTLNKNAANLFTASGDRGLDNFSLSGVGTSKEGEGRGPASYDASLGISRTQFQSLTQAVENFNQTLEKMQMISTEINDTRKDVQSLVEAHQINAFILQEIERIKLDPALKPEQIKRMSHAYMTKALNLSDQSNGELNLDSLLRKGNTRAQLVNILEKVKEKHDDFREQKAQLNTLKASLTDQFSENLLLNSQYVQPAVQSYDQALNQENEITTLENNILQLVTDIPEVDVLKLASLWREYEALQANTFTKDYRTLADADNIVFNIRLTPNDSGVSNKAPAIQIAPIEVPVAGGFKVNASIGLAFGQLFKRPQSYFVRDSFIRAEDKDSFFPIVASFFHFYSQSKNTVSFGGNFGIGLPITGDSGQSASFFLGPSLLIGRDNRLVLNAGLMGTRVERLAQGFQLGDSFPSRVNNVPTKNVYEMGYFLGLSFNVIGSNK